MGSESCLLTFRTREGKLVRNFPRSFAHSVVRFTNTFRRLSVALHPNLEAQRERPRLYPNCVNQLTAEKEYAVVSYQRAETGFHLARFAAPLREDCGDSAAQNI